ncbi:hypothetical protein KCV87_24970 [Actinosynnema pretiosum subsp. pretiosum]|uniref:Uncharacterized protein n=1 Tax=Actinosynnema pretiosum subsp. pretiosum TaxID=103721 RepID=A0AA45R2E4_9PSEU|nr:hypothetical protein [Actinosynnema mirum]AXX33513.1 hypothetical protein APASM_6148 [Actinosynnema pretiosum subsp. pretiosum]QUF02686.1 hypothetical protein KCV87_24970 [Actinosynnema pretiosum subsp. pretiosum]
MNRGLFVGVVVLGVLLVGVLMPTANAGEPSANGGAIYTVFLAAILAGTMLGTSDERR